MTLQIIKATIFSIFGVFLTAEIIPPEFFKI